MISGGYKIMKKLISFCLYGNDPVYIKGAILNAKASKKVL